MAVVDEGVYEHRQFLGLRNRVGPSGFELGDLDAAENIDLDDAGGAMLRRGHGAASIAGSCHSLWSNGDFCYAVVGNALTQVLPGLTTKTLRSGLTADRRVEYVAVGDRTFYANGIENGVAQAGASRSWGLPVPPSPAVNLVPGELPPGRYQVSLTYLRADLQESGASVATVVDVSAGQGLSVVLPSSTDPDVTMTSMYVSKPDGATLYLSQTVLAAATLAVYLYPDSSTAILGTQHLAPPPVGDFLGIYNGHALVAAGDTLFYSEPYAYELFDLRKRQRFGSRIVMLAPVKGGVFVGTENQTIFLEGPTPGVFNLQELTDYGVIPHTASRTSASRVEAARSGDCVVWTSKRGICAGFDGGALLNLTEDRFAYPIQPTGAGLVRLWRGINQYVATLRGAEVPGNIAG